jgi:hypothetical protein
MFMPADYYKTPVAAQKLGITYHRLIGLLRHRKIDPPARDSSGDYIWATADLNRARRALAAMRRPKPETAEAVSP